MAPGRLMDQMGIQASTAPEVNQEHSMSLPPEDAALRDFFDSLQSQGYCPTWVAGRRIDLSQGPIKSVEFRD